MKTLLLLGTVGCALASAALPQRAAACSASACSPGSFFLEPGARIPANAPALYWQQPHDYLPEGAPTPTLHIAREDGTAVAFELEPGANEYDPVVVRLPDGLTEGARYRITVDFTEDCPAAGAELEAGAAAELPQQLGAIVLAEPRRDFVHLWTTSGSCFAPVPAAVAEVDLELSAEAKPWAALFDYRHLVDRAEWNPSWSFDDGFFYGNDSDVLQGAQTWVFTECAGPLPDGRPIDERVQHQGVAEGEHSVTIEARLPGVERVLRSDTVEVALACGEPAAEPEPSPTGEPASPPNGGDDGDEPVPAPARGDDPMAAAGSAGAGAGFGADGMDDDADSRRDRTYVEAMPEDDRGCAAVAPGGARGRAASPAFASALLALLALAIRGRSRSRNARAR